MCRILDACLPSSFLFFSDCSYEIITTIFSSFDKHHTDKTFTRYEDVYMDALADFLKHHPEQCATLQEIAVAVAKPKPLRCSLRAFLRKYPEVVLFFRIILLSFFHISQFRYCNRSRQFV
jgi:hypothetical protein